MFRLSPVFSIMSFGSNLSLSVYISVLGWPKIMGKQILDNSTLPYLSLSARISLIAILVMEIQKITRRCICAVWNLEQFLLCTVLDQVNCIIWKSVLWGSCGEFDKLSNGISYNIIGLTKWELQLFYCAAVFLLVRNFRFLVLAI